jgi:hypothetical protein
MSSPLPTGALNTLNGAPAGTYTVSPVDPAAFSTARISPVRHTFTTHPLLQLDALRELAKSLYPTGQCRFIQPGTTTKAPFKHESAEHSGRSIDDVFSRIEERGSWLALYNVETHPAYKAFLAEATASYRHLVEKDLSGVRHVGGFIFISSPPSITPFHIDREHNFWLQVSGRKVISVWDHNDREVVPGPLVDRFIAFGDLAPVALNDAFANRAQVFDVRAGDGVYFPPTSPHTTRSDESWSVAEDGVSISIGTVFYTAQSTVDAQVHAGNVLLRQLGMSPAHPGASPMGDAFKRPLGQAFIWAKKTFQGFTPNESYADR